MMGSWQATEAGQNIGHVLRAAQVEPQMLMQKTEPVGIVLSVEQYRRLVEQADAEFATFLLSSPLEPGDFDGDAGFGLSRD